ncbi:MAG: RNA polymerase sigma factor [Planctomycetota bacterium]
MVRRVPSMITDDQLMLRAAGGDMVAFEALVERHQQGALNVAYRFLGAAGPAEDVAQEAFLKVLEAAPRYRAEGRFRAYLYSIIWHLCVDRHRHQGELGLDEAPPLANGTPGPAEAALQEERQARVQQALRRLPSRQRMALVLQHYEGLSYQEIARALECSPVAVDALLVRAKRKLRDELQDLL